MSADTTTDTMIKFLQQFGQLSDEMITEIDQILIKQELSKKNIIQRTGRVCDHLYFLEKGLARNYSEKEEKVFTNDIVIDGELLTAFASFVSRQPSEETIELLEDSIIFSIRYDDLQKLYLRFPALERIGRLVAEQRYISLSSRTHRLQTYSSAERYEHLIKYKPEIVKRTPIGIIASYLGMTIETLSRIRGKVG